MATAPSRSHAVDALRDGASRPAAARCDASADRRRSRLSDSARARAPSRAIS